MSSSSKQKPTTLPPGPPPKEHYDAADSALGLLVIRAAHGILHPYTPTKSSDFSKLYKDLIKTNPLENFEDAWHLGNYVLDRQSGKKTFEPMSIYVRLGMHFLYYGSGQEAMLQWKRVQEMLKYRSEQMGTAYDAPLSKVHIKEFIKMFELQDSLKDLLQPDPDKYATFNEFFAREIKLSTRPIAEPDDPFVVSSPADCRLTVFPTVDEATKYWIKGNGFTIGRLLASNELAGKFSGGNLAIARLAPQDYHRWHSPVEGRIMMIVDIPGTYYTVNPMAVNQPGTLNVFCENRRSLMVIRRGINNTLVAIVAVGAMLVGSIKYNPGIKLGTDVRRGQCLGYFQYGGSTVIVLFPPAEVTLDEDLVADSTKQKCETLVKVGERIGKGGSIPCCEARALAASPT
jgi:phosphatidylserine decarboxylase